MRTLLRRPGRLIPALLSILRRSRRPRDLLVAVRATAAACFFAERVHPDVIHAQFAGPAAAVAFVWHRLTLIPYTVRAHAYDIYTPYGWAGCVLGESAMAIAISQHGREHVRHQFGVGAEIIRVGIPTDRVSRRSPVKAGHPFRFVSVGALTEKKGHRLAINAIKELNRRGIEVTHDIYGAGPDADAIEEMIADDPSITLWGAIPTHEIRARYREYDALIMASVVDRLQDMDGIPVVIMEAMAAELPVASTLVGGIGELVVQGETGTVLPGDVSGMADSLMGLVDRYDDARRWAKAARAKVERDHDITAAASRLVDNWEALARP